MNESHRTDDAREGRRIAQWSLARVAEAIDGDLSPLDAGEARPTGISTDTRTIESGELFVALRGERFDGHDFVDEANRRGAIGAIVDRDADSGELESDDFALLRVDETLEALQTLGRSLWDEADRAGLHTIAITGSNGKTTTKEMAAAIWSAQGRVHKTAGNLNNHIGLPLTLCDLPADCDHLVVEMGANAPGEIAELVRMAPGDERVITSIGLDHPEGFGSIEGVRRAKAEIAEGADASTTWIVPHAERSALPAVETFPGEIWTFGSEPEADLYIRETVPSTERPDTQRIEFVCGEHTWSLPLGLPGDHNASNLAAALSTALARGVSPVPDEWAPALRSIELPGGRWRRVEVDGLDFVDDAYNANPSNVEASLEAFVELELDDDVARIAILGDMRELGERAEQLHCSTARAVGRHSTLDAVGFLGSHADSMAEAAREEATSTEIRAHLSIESVTEWIVARRPASVWLKASRAAELERVIERADDLTSSRD